MHAMLLVLQSEIATTRRAWLQSKKLGKACFYLTQIRPYSYILVLNKERRADGLALVLQMRAFNRRHDYGGEVQRRYGETGSQRHIRLKH